MVFKKRLCYFIAAWFILARIPYSTVVDAGAMPAFSWLQFNDSRWPVLVLGALMFIPGAYHVRIAYYAYKKYPGYTYDDIPDFD